MNTCLREVHYPVYSRTQQKPLDNSLAKTKKKGKEKNHTDNKHKLLYMMAGQSLLEAGGLRQVTGDDLSPVWGGLSSVSDRLSPQDLGQAPQLHQPQAA